MNIDEALKVLYEVAAGFTGTLKDHQTIQTALGVVKDAVKEKQEDKKEEENKQDE